MKKGLLLFLLICLSGAAFANPVIIDPIGSTAFVAVLGSAMVVEASIIAILLLFFDMRIGPVFAALFAGNLALYFIVFLPLLDAAPSLWIPETVIVAIEGTFIKIISFYDTFQMDSFKSLKWKYAFIISAVGNIVSYYVGAVMNT